MDNAQYSRITHQLPGSLASNVGCALTCGWAIRIETCRLPPLLLARALPYSVNCAGPNIARFFRVPVPFDPNRCFVKSACR